MDFSRTSIGKSYYSSSRPFSQGGFAIFSIFANSINLLCKLHYVNFATKEVPRPGFRASVRLNLVFLKAFGARYWRTPWGFSDYRDYIPYYYNLYSAVLTSQRQWRSGR